MKSLTISEGFRQAIGARPVKRAFFSTYSFEPHFFELEVLPLLLDGPTLSTDEIIRYHQLAALMSDSRGRFAVAYDMDVFRPEYAPRLEVDYVAVRVDGACQHAKIAVIEVENADGTPAIILAAGSFNLTFAGWWTNIEVGHWIELNADKYPENIAAPLTRALAFFQRQGDVPALAALQATLAKWTAGRRDPDCTFYFSGAGPGRHAFPALLQAVSHGHVDIVSPFFSDQGDNTQVAAFLNRFGSVSLFVPRDEAGIAQMTEAVHAALSKRVTWCGWHAEMSKKGYIPPQDAPNATQGKGFRILHAKIYSGQGWLFIGSVNLSYKALHENVEAGFLLTNLPGLNLLAADKQALEFVPVDPVKVPGSDDAASMPPIQLAYHWQSGELHALSPITGALTLYDAEGTSYGTYALQAGVSSVLAIAAIAAQLKRSSLVNASWTRPDNISSERRTLLVSQRQVYCRPTVLPALDVQDLLRIFQNMHPSARVAFIATLAARQARLDKSGLSSNEFLPPLPAAELPPSFFSEFSEVNGAFWNMRKELAKAKSKQQADRLAYYLDSDQPDSLRGVARSLGAAATHPVSTIVKYLVLLSMDEILEIYASGNGALAHDVRALIAQTEQGAEFNALPEKDKFLEWVKEKFKASVHPVEAATQEQNNG